MKYFARLSLMGSGLGLILLTATPSFGAVVGELLTGGNGTVTVSASGITFSENNVNPTASTEVGTGTTLSFDGGSLMVGQPIDIAGGTIIPSGTPPPPVVDFMTFPDAPTLSVTLDSFGPGSSNSNCAGLTTGESCSIHVDGFTSPIILTYTGTGVEGTSTGSEGMSALLNVNGTATDGSGIISNFSGHFSASLANQTPLQLEEMFLTNPGASVTTTYAGDFFATPPSTVPEPRTISMVAIAGLLMGLVVVKRRKTA